MVAEFLPIASILDTLYLKLLFTNQRLIFSDALEFVRLISLLNDELSPGGLVRFGKTTELYL